ncbi:MAG: HEAT repeat domain-containing protein [bacterium]
MKEFDVKLVEEALNSDDIAVRKQCIEECDEANAKEFAAVYFEAWKKWDLRFQLRTSALLRNKRECRRNILIEAMKDGDDKYWLCSHLLQSSPNDYEDLLLTMIVNSKYDTKLLAADHLQEYDSPLVRDSLRQNLTHEDPFVVLASAIALAKTGDDDVYNILKNNLQNDDFWLRSWAVQGVGEFGKIEDLEVLLPFLKDEDDDVKDNAYYAVSMLGKDDVIDIVAAGLADANHRVKSAAMWGLVGMGGKKAYGILKAALNTETDKEIRQEIIDRISDFRVEEM